MLRLSLFSLALLAATLPALAAPPPFCTKRNMATSLGGTEVIASYVAPPCLPCINVTWTAQSYNNDTYSLLIGDNFANDPTFDSTTYWNPVGPFVGNSPVTTSATWNPVYANPALLSGFACGNPGSGTDCQVTVSTCIYFDCAA